MPDIRKLYYAAQELIKLINAAKRQDKQVTALFFTSGDYSVKATFKRVKNSGQSQQFRKDIANRVWIDEAKDLPAETFMGLKLKIDPTLSPGEAHIKNHHDKIVGKITNLDKN